MFRQILTASGIENLFGLQSADCNRSSVTEHSGNQELFRRLNLVLYRVSLANDTKRKRKVCPPDNVSIGHLQQRFRSYNWWASDD